MDKRIEEFISNLPKIVTGSRGSGKTTEIVEMSHHTGGRIVTTRVGKMYTKKLAKDLNYTIPEPLTMKEALDLDLSEETILLDEMEYVLWELLGCKNIGAMSYTDWTDFIKEHKGSDENTL